MQNFTLVVNQGAAILTGNGTTFTVVVLGSFTVMTSGSPTPTLTETPPLPAGITFVDNGDGTGTLSGTPAAGTGGAYPITFTANNGVDNPAMQAFTLNINQGPAITSSNTVTFNELTMGSFVVMSTGDPTPTLTEVGNLPNGVVFMDNGDGTAFLGGIPAAGSGGQYGFTITASNGVLPNATQTFTLVVVSALSITSPSNASFTVGAQILFTITTAGTPLPTVTKSGALPAGITFTPLNNGTATLSGSPQAGTEGIYSITFTATNGTGASTTQTFTLTVRPPGIDSAPAITSANQATFSSGLPAGVPTPANPNPYNYFKVTTTGFPVPALTVIDRATGKAFPGFKDNHDGTGTISYELSGFRTAFTYHLTITATGAGGAPLAATQLFALHFVPLPPFPTFTSADQVAFTQGVHGSFTVAAGPFVNSITIEAGALPFGITLMDNHNGTATLSGRPVSTGIDAMTLRAGNTANTFYSATQAFTIGVLP
jgi:large repetitive protein